ncbi:MAG: hypothetical protein ABDH28_07000 [Brevinematia bacterium]
MVKKLVAVSLIALCLISNSCIKFAVLSPTTEASSLSPKEAKIEILNYTRNLCIQARKGIFKDKFLGTEFGFFISYALPDENFQSTGLLLDFKLSLFETNKTKFATGLGLSYLSILKKINDQNPYVNSLYAVFPLYMESSLTEWFKFTLNFRFFSSLFPQEEKNLPPDMQTYKSNLLTVNLGVDFFDTLRLEGYLLGGREFQTFPIPGFGLNYTLRF